MNAQMLQPPENKTRVLEKVPPYSFALPDFDGQSVFKVDTIFGGQSLSGQPGKVSNQKPKHLSDIDGRDPEYLITCDLRALEKEASNN
jgi:hypothetical protein